MTGSIFALLAAAVLMPLKPGSIVSRGWLRAQLELAKAGMSGHLGELEPDQMELPYVTRDFDPSRGARGLVGWCAEMGAEFALSQAYLAYALDDAELLAKTAMKVKGARKLQEEDGYLGAYRKTDDRKSDYSALGSAMFFDMMLLEYFRTGDAETLDSVRRGLLWFARTWSPHRTAYAAPAILEPCAVVARLTGDREILDFAVDYAEWLEREPHKKPGRFTSFPLSKGSMHVANLSNRLKLPAAMAWAADRADWLTAVERMFDAYRDGFGWQATHSPCADGEFVQKPSCIGETEYCDHVFLQESLCWYATLTAKALYADALERLVFNAGQGARAGDERSIGYMSAPNQWYATLKSSHWGPEPFYQVYAPNINPACCPANSIRLYPQYLFYSVRREGRDGLCFLNYAPCRIQTELEGNGVAIVCETDYPFDGRVRLTIDAENWRGTLRLRRPTWATKLAVWRGAKRVSVPERDGFFRVAGPWNAGETLTVDFGWEPVIREVRDRDFTEPLRTVEWGALVFSQPIAEKWMPVPRAKPRWGTDTSLPQPKDWPWFDVSPVAEPIAYALPADLKPDRIRVLRVKGDAVPWRRSPVRLVVPLERAAAAYPASSRDGVHTPRPAANPVRGDGIVDSVEFVPFGSTALRVTCFPVTTR